MPIALFFSSCQISAHPIRNFRANPSTPGLFDNIDYIGQFINDMHSVQDNIIKETVELLTAQCPSLLYNAADAAGMIKQSNFSNSSQKAQKKYSRPWFNADCRKMRQQYRRAKNVRRLVSDNEYFHALNDASKAYKKCLN